MCSGIDQSPTSSPLVPPLSSKTLQSTVGTWPPCAPPPPPPPGYTSALLTQSVASNIFRSNGSPTSSPSMRVSEWQVAMAAMNGPLGRGAGGLDDGEEGLPLERNYAPQIQGVLGQGPSLE